jgi:hypothetical protein
MLKAPFSKWVNLSEKGCKCLEKGISPKFAFTTEFSEDL